MTSNGASHDLSYVLYISLNILSYRLNIFLYYSKKLKWHYSVGKFLDIEISGANY